MRGPGEAVVTARQDLDAPPMHLAHGEGGGLDLALQALLDGHFRGKAVGDGFAGAGGVGEVDSWADEDAIFDGFEHVHGFLVSETSVIDDVDTGAATKLDGVVGAGVGGDAFATHVSLLDGRAGFLEGEVGFLGTHRLVDLVPGHGEFDVVNAEGAELPGNFSHLVHAVGEFRDGGDDGATGGGDLLTVGQDARTRNHSRLDGGFGDDVEARLGGSGAEAHGVATVKVHLCRIGSMEDMLLDREIGQTIESWGIVPREVGV